MQHPQIDLQSAISEAPATALRLLELANKQRGRQNTALEYHTTRHWESSAGTWCYLTHIAAPEQHNVRLAQLTRIFYNSATLTAQPWYPQFQGGKSQDVNAPLPEGIQAQQLTLGQFDLGLSTPRYYRQLVSLAQPDAQTAVIVARSVSEGPVLPEGARLAYTLAPNGEGVALGKWSPALAPHLLYTRCRTTTHDARSLAYQCTAGNAPGRRREKDLPAGSGTLAGLG